MSDVWIDPELSSRIEFAYRAGNAIEMSLCLKMAKAEIDRLRAEKVELLETINVIHEHAVDACPSDKISHIEWLCRAALHKAANDTEGK